MLLPVADIPLDLGGGLNLPTLGFTLLIAVVATLLSGTAPALLTARSSLNEALKEGGRSGGAGSGSHRLRGLLVVCEMALVMVALIGAGLFYRSFQNASGIAAGVRPDQYLRVAVLSLVRGLLGRGAAGFLPEAPRADGVEAGRDRRDLLGCDPHVDGLRGRLHALAPARHRRIRSRAQ